ncbi:MAG TPA: alkaline phosphatase family protein [Candidatus Sulfotelmatobacter sp.]|nr:alkaline phosphatase family protein [Candidatus Sulfotelmatobacter sp.]
MNHRLAIAAALLALLPVQNASAAGVRSVRAIRAAVPVSYAAPAGDLPVEHLHGATYDAVLPSGRLVTPAGTSVVTGMNALGLALSPDGRYAIVSNDDELDGAMHSLVDPNATGGYVLAVVDLATMQVVSRYRAPGETYWNGIAALADPARPGGTLVLASGGTSGSVYVFRLDASGALTPDPRHVIALPGSSDPAFAARGHALASTLAVSADGKRAYVVDDAGDSISAIDTATRRLSGSSWPVGFFPFGVAPAGDQLLVTNEGLLRYGVLGAPVSAPPFAPPAADLDRASSLSLLALGANGDLGAPASLPMDPTPDGIRTVGGAHPTAVVVTPDDTHAYVAMSGVDRIATVELGASPRVVGGTELRLFDRGPYGTEPAALALSRDGSRLYVALAGLNAVAVIDARDPAHLHRMGLIPTGWYPSALALGADDRTLYVLNTKGFGSDAGAGADPNADGTAVWSTLEKIDLGAVRLTSATQNALGNTRRVVAARAMVPPGLRDVVVIEQAGKGFDAMLGDLGAPAGDPSLVQYGEAVTPNLHALARRYALATNFFADDAIGAGNQQFLTAGTASLFAERLLRARAGRDGLGTAAQDPEDWPRLGSIFDSLARHRMSYRDYGDLLTVAGYDDGRAADPRADDPYYAGPADTSAPTQGLGGLYAQNVPAPAALADHVDLQYPGWNPRIRDERRAQEFIRDYSTLVASGREPRYVHLWLPADAAVTVPGAPPPAEQVADGDRALGEIVAYLSHLRSWRHTAIIIVGGDAPGSHDHVDATRSYAVVVSPFAKRHALDARHLSTASVLKTAEEALHVGTLSLGDLLATDLTECLTAHGGDEAPYVALPVPEQAAASR